MYIAHEWLQHFIKTHGYLGVYSSLMLGMFGLPVPDETILALTGFLVFKGLLQPLPAFLAAFLGSICGVTLEYLLGRNVGWPLLHKYGGFLHLTDEKIDKSHRWFEKNGKFALFFGYFLPGVRHLTAFAAGASRNEFRLFAPYAYIGGLCWVLVFLALGYFLGEESHKIVAQVHSYLWILLIIIFVTLVGYYLGSRLRNYGRRR